LNHYLQLRKLKRKKLKDKIKKLKEKLKDIKKNKKCKNHKYNDVCDKQKPKIKITHPEKKEKHEIPLINIEIDASDKISGVKKVLVRIDKGPWEMAVNTGEGTWELEKDLPVGKYKVTAKAFDFVNNKKRDSLKFFIVEA